MISKLLRLKSGHSLLPAHKSKNDPYCVTCVTPFKEHHLLFECKNLQLLQSNFINNDH